MGSIDENFRHTFSIDRARALISIVAIYSWAYAHHYHHRRCQKFDDRLYIYELDLPLFSSETCKIVMNDLMDKLHYKQMNWESEKTQTDLLLRQCACVCVCLNVYATVRLKTLLHPYIIIAFRWFLSMNDFCCFVFVSLFHSFVQSLHQRSQTRAAFCCFFYQRLFFLRVGT